MTGDKPINGATVKRLLDRMLVRIQEKPKRLPNTEGLYTYRLRVGTYQKY